MTWKVKQRMNEHQRNMIISIGGLALSMGELQDKGIELAVQDELWAPYLKFLALYAHYARVGVALETGTFNGTSALHLSFGANHVITIDREPQAPAYRIAEVRKNVTLLIGDSCGAWPQVKTLCDKHGPIDLLFLDSTHDGETPRREFETYRDLLADEAVVIVDDLLGPEHLRVQMQAFWEWLPGEKVELHALHPQRIAPGVAYHDAPGFGVAIVRKE